MSGRQPATRMFSINQKGTPNDFTSLIKPCSLHTFSLHAHGQALLIAAILAAIALALVHQALFVIPAGIAQVFAHSSFEETFTTLTAIDPVVLACKLHKLQTQIRKTYIVQTGTEHHFVKMLRKHRQKHLTVGDYTPKTTKQSNSLQLMFLLILLLVHSPEERSPQMTHNRFWDNISPGLWAGTGLRPNGGLISSELLTECIPAKGAEEEIWIHNHNKTLQSIWMLLCTLQTTLHFFGLLESLVTCILFNT